MIRKKLFQLKDVCRNVHFVKIEFVLRYDLHQTQSCLRRSELQIFTLNKKINKLENCTLLDLIGTSLIIILLFFI